MPAKRWELRPVEDPGVVDRLRRDLNDLPAPLARALALRGIDSVETARVFFRAALDDLLDPFLMQDMDRAADRVVQAIETGEKVLVYGDYDVDGTTSTALMTSFLRSRGVDTIYFIPNRMTDGYGLGPTGLDYAADEGASLVVALDCGITAIEMADYARAKGLDLVICDHHTAGDELPKATAVLDPKRRDCPYPFKELSGCGVGFKLVQAVLQRLGLDPALAYDYLDLVAVSIASDIVPVYGENRILLREGLRRLKDTPRIGFRALAEQARLDLKRASSSLVVFSMGPRINAAGRMGDAGRATALMIEDNAYRARELAQTLEGLNRERRELDRQTLQEARKMADRQLSGRMRHSVVLYGPHWHPGVIGIVASRIVEHYYRPTVMLCEVNGTVKGSARSVNGINVYDAIKRCEDLLLGFGGHDFAAGVSLDAEQVDAFREQFDLAVRDSAEADPAALEPVVEVDARLALDEIGGVEGRFWKVLRQFAPFGPDNLAPTFLADDLEVVGEPRTVGPTGQHLKFRVRRRGTTEAHDVIAFKMGDRMPMLQESRYLGRPLELLFSIEENTWKGQTSLQLKARDFRLAEREEPAAPEAPLFG